MTRLCTTLHAALYSSIVLLFDQCVHVCVREREKESYIIIIVHAIMLVYYSLYNILHIAWLRIVIALNSIIISPSHHVRIIYISIHFFSYVINLQLDQ